MEKCRSGNSDSPDFMFSIQGFDPCFYFDFTKVHTFKFKLNCKTIDTKGLVDLNSEKLGLGYSYRDVLSENFEPGTGSNSRSLPPN